VPRVRRVTRAQVMAAKLVVEMDLEDGREPDPLAVKIANARPLTPPLSVDDEFVFDNRILPD
jgi:hypothetical protein